MEPVKVEFVGSDSLEKAISDSYTQESMVHGPGGFMEEPGPAWKIIDNVAEHHSDYQNFIGSFTTNGTVIVKGNKYEAGVFITTASDEMDGDGCSLDILYGTTPSRIFDKAEDAVSWVDEISTNNDDIEFEWESQNSGLTPGTPAYQKWLDENAYVEED